MNILLINGYYYYYTRLFSVNFKREEYQLFLFSVYHHSTFLSSRINNIIIYSIYSWNEKNK